jgi:hypothetical protein
MTEVSPLILNVYLSRSYKIFGPTVNPSPHVSGIAFREWQEKTASGTSVVTSKPANGGQVKTGQRIEPETR